MKKLISLVLVLVVSLAAVSALAEVAVATPSVAAQDLAEAVKDIAIVDPPEVNGEPVIAVDETKLDASTILLNSLLEGTHASSKTFADTYKGVEGLADAVSVVAAPMPVPSVAKEAKDENGALKEEFQQIIVTLEAEASPATIEYLKTFEGLKAVFTYFDGTDFVSNVIEFSLEDGKITYLIPLEVLNAASGCPCFVNFVC